MENDLAIIIPTYNEEQVILKTLKVISQKVKIPHEIIVVDGRSRDNTKKIVKKMASSQRNIKIISQDEKNNGFADAIALGIKNANNKFIVIVMADLCDDPVTINKMYKKINEGWDVVCGCRYMKGARKIGGPKIQGFFSYVVCKSLNLLIGIPTQDVSNAFKMYRTERIKNSVLKSIGTEASMELALQAYFQKARMIDIPTTWLGRSKGVSKFKILERAPRYAEIYLWAIKKHFR